MLCKIISRNATIQYYFYFEASYIFIYRICMLISIYSTTNRYANLFFPIVFNYIEKPWYSWQYFMNPFLFIRKLSSPRCFKAQYLQIVLKVLPREKDPDKKGSSNRYLVQREAGRVLEF
jgi:hypothetical protein